MANNGYLLTVITFLPLLGSGALLLLRRDDLVWIRRLAMVTSLAEFALSLLLIRGFSPESAAYQFEENRQWIQAFNIQYHLGLDGISLWLVILTTFLTPIAVLCSWKGIHHR